MPKNDTCDLVGCIPLSLLLPNSISTPLADRLFVVARLEAAEEMILMLLVCPALASHPSYPLNLEEAFLTFFLELGFALVLFPRTLIFLHLRTLLNLQIILLHHELLAPLP